MIDLTGDPLPVERFDYELPQELIAQAPIEPRDASRLLVIDRAAQTLTDRLFTDLPDYLRPGDLIVVNDTRVMPARLFARRRTGGRVEFLLLSQTNDRTWVALARPARRLVTGEVVHLVDQNDTLTDATVTVTGRTADGILIDIADADAIARYGRTPLPPYIKQQVSDPERYQTVYARESGSAAAPTAGMHFTPALMERCVAAGATFAHVTLHVGRDTFEPIKTVNALDHHMHAEWYHVPSHTVAQIVDARAQGGRVLAIGTTSVRTLESTADRLFDSNPGDLSGETRLYITPGYAFHVVDAMVTNFHLPRTTLLLLVAALLGEDMLRRAYHHAILERYRFYSFGDAMLIV